MRASAVLLSVIPLYECDVERGGGGGEEDLELLARGIYDARAPWE